MVINMAVSGWESGGDGRFSRLVHKKCMIHSVLVGAEELRHATDLLPRVICVCECIRYRATRAVPCVMY